MPTTQCISFVFAFYLFVAGEESGKTHVASFHEHPNVIPNSLREKETAILFRTAVQCWQLLQSNEILQMDFKQLLLSLPCSQYCNKFLVDLAFYMGEPDEAKVLLNDSTLGTSALEKNLRHLSLTIHQPTSEVCNRTLEDLRFVFTRNSLIEYIPDDRIRFDFANNIRFAKNPWQLPEKSHIDR